MAQTRTTRARLEAAVVALAPVVLLVGLLWHPYIGMGLPDEAAIAAAVTAGTTRWGLSHLTVAVASGLVILAFLALRSYLREAGEERSSGFGVPFIVIGSTLFAVLPGMETAQVAVAESGGDVRAAQAALFPWFVPVLLIGAVNFAIGIVGFAKGIADSGILNRQRTLLVLAALSVMAAARFVPLAVVQSYVQGAAGIVALWPLAYEMWRHPHPRPAGRAPTTPAISPEVKGSPAG